MTFITHWLGSSIGSCKVRFAALGLIIGIASVLNLWLVAQDNRPPPWDYATYLTRSVEFYNAARTGSVSQFLSAYNDPYRPPLVPLMVLPFYAIVGVSYGAAMFVNLVFIAILAISTYELGKKLSSPVLGVLSALAAVTLPGIIVFEGVFGLDFPLTALVAAGTCLIFVSDNFNNRRVSVLLGLVLGLGMLTKWTYIVFVVPLIAWEGVRNWRKVHARNALTAMVIFLGISSTWYVSAIQQGLLPHLTSAALARSYAVSSSVFDISSLLYYPSMLARNLGPLYWTSFLVLAGISIIFLLKRRIVNQLAVSAPMAISLLFSVMSAILVFTLLTNKSVRFILPAAPILVTLLLFVVLKWHQRVSSVVLLIMLLAGSFTSLAGALQPQLGEFVGIYIQGNVSDVNYSYEYSPPSLADWRLDQALEFVAAQDANALVAVIANHWVFNQDTLKYYALRLGFGGINFQDSRGSQIGTDPDVLNNYDVVFLKTANVGSPALGRVATQILTRLSNPSDPFYLTWKVGETLELPDQSQLKIYVKIVANSPAGPINVSIHGHFDLPSGLPIAMEDATKRPRIMWISILSAEHTLAGEVATSLSSAC